MNYQTIDITLCVGLYGVCVLSILGDDYDMVSSDIEENGTEQWYDNLPEHNKPIEGVYTIKCTLISTTNYFSYQITNNKAAA